MTALSLHQQIPCDIVRTSKSILSTTKLLSAPSGNYACTTYSVVFRWRLESWKSSAGSRFFQGPSLR